MQGSTVGKRTDWSENVLSLNFSCPLSEVWKGSGKEKGLPGRGSACVELWNTKPPGEMGELQEGRYVWRTRRERALVAGGKAVLDAKEIGF